MNAIPLAQQKSTLRTTARAHRQALCRDISRQRPGYAERAATEFLAAIAPPADAVVSVYWPLEGEFDTRPLLHALHAQGRRCVLPIVVARGKPLIFRQWTPESELVPASFGLLEPPAEMPALRPDILVVPMLAFDKAGFRLGYGGGYYDRTLAALREQGPAPMAVGLAFSGQEVPGVPHDSTDERLDRLVSETGVRAFDGTPAAGTAS